jgi:autotransporter-associated beta strand protein
LALLAAPFTAIGQSLTWDGGANTNNWGGTLNWDTTPSFTATTDVFFRSGTAGFTTTAIAAARTVRSITFNGNVTSTFEIRLTGNNYNTNQNLTMGNATNAAAITIGSGITGDILIGKGTGAIVNGGNLILGNNLTVTQNSTSSMLTINAPIIESGGSYGLTKNGSGTLTIDKANTYTGTTTINAGNLTLSGGSAIVNNGTISLADTAGAILHVAASETIGSLQGGGTTGGNVSIAASETLTVDETGTNTFGGVILGSGGLTKSGAGTLTLSNTNTYNGSTTISAGTLAVSGNIASSGLVLNSGGIISPGTSAAADSFGTSSITINGGG